MTIRIPDMPIHIMPCRSVRSKSESGCNCEAFVRVGSGLRNVDQQAFGS